MQQTIRERFTIEELLGQEVERRNVRRPFPPPDANDPDQRGKFRPGLRVRRIDPPGERYIERWADYPGDALTEG